MAWMLDPLPAHASFLTQEGSALVLPLRYCDNYGFQASSPEEHGYHCTVVTVRAMGRSSTVLPGTPSFQLPL